jgi:acyl-coenzyme A synthetase/AMP-(fatty) acid ligase
LHFKSWTQLLESADAVGRRLGIRRFSHVLSTVPPYHLYGLEHGLFMPWRAGVSLYRKRLLFPPDIRAAATLGHCALLVTTPFHLRALVESGLTVAGLGLIVCSTAPLSTALARESEKRFKTPVVEVYGSTETGALATRRTVREENWHLLDHVKLARQGKRPCIAWRRQGTTRFLDDEVEALDSTHLRLLGRRQDIVKVAGRRASLAALNEALLGIPGVRSGAFYHPRERETRGEPERLVAFVVAPGLPPESILVQLRQRIDGPFLPRPLVVVEEIPHHPTGKISQATLAGLYREHLAQPHDSAAH